MKDTKIKTINNLMKFWTLFSENMDKLSKEDGESLKIFAQTVEFHVDQGNFSTALRESSQLISHILSLTNPEKQ